MERKMKRKGVRYERQELFCAYVAAGMSYTDAYIEAGYEAEKRATCTKKASELFHGDPYIRNRIAELNKKLVESVLKKKEKQMEKIIDQLQQIADVKVSDVIDVKKDRTVTIKDTTLPGVKNVRFDKEGRLLAIDMQDIQSALDKLIRIFGGYKDSVAVELSGSMSIEHVLKELQGTEF